MRLILSPLRYAQAYLRISGHVRVVFVCVCVTRVYACEKESKYVQGKESSSFTELAHRTIGFPAIKLETTDDPIKSKNGDYEGCVVPVSNMCTRISPRARSIFRYHSECKGNEGRKVYISHLSCVFFMNPSHFKNHQ